MASSSRRSARNRGGTLADEGDPFIIGAPMAPRDRGAMAMAPALPRGHQSLLRRYWVSPWLTRGTGVASDSPLFRRTLNHRWTGNGWLSIDRELADEEFCNCLEQAGVLHSILISRSLNMFRDTEALRQLMLPILGDQDSAEVERPPEELKVEAALADYIGRKNTSLGTQACELYTQLDLLHAEELVGLSCHMVATAFNSFVVYTFLWEHALDYITKGRKPYEAKNKFATMAEEVVVPSCLISSLDHESKVCWRPYGVTHRGFVYEFGDVWASRDVEAQDYTLIAEDTRSLTYLSTTNAGWLPVLSSGKLQFTAYCDYRMRRQFGFNEEVPAVIGVAAGEIPTINPFLKAKAFAYWSSVAPRVMIPNGDRVDIYTTGTLLSRLQRRRKQLAARAGGSKGVVIQEATIQDPLPVEESVAQGSKQRADTLHRVSTCDTVRHLQVTRLTLPGAAAEEVEGEDAKIAAEETASDEETIVAEVTSDDEATAMDASSGEEGTVVEASTNEDIVSMYEVETAEASFDNVLVASASNPRSVERASDEHIAVGAVTSAMRAAEAEPIAITSSGGTAQGNPSRSDNRMDPSLFDSSPPTRHYVQRAPRGIIAAMVSAATTVQEDKTVPTATEETPGNEEVPVHISDIPEEATASENPVLADVLPGSDIPVMEGTFAQDLADDVSMEDMVETHDSYDAVFAGIEDHVAGTQAADLEVTALAATHMSPTKTAGRGNKAITEEGGRHQTVAVESAAMGQPGLLSATRPATLGILSLRMSLKFTFVEWKAVVQEITREGFKFNFILDYLQRLAHDIFSRRILAELRAVEARAVALRDALSIIAPDLWDLASARGVSAEPHVGSVLYGLLACLSISSTGFDLKLGLIFCTYLLSTLIYDNET
uniref:Aminotransferase-like plant mobile domain-containing protein n=1 Tax=Fagus sylvatica TaxID=28930 RepID=A0A2N9GE07_FAGSY